MNQAEQELSRLLEADADSFDDYFEEDGADAPLISKRAGNRRQGALKMSKAKGNPTFSAQFDLSILLKYYTVVTATGVYTSIAAAALNAGLKNRLPVYIFGNSDSQSGFPNIRQYFPLNAWVHGRPGIYGKSDFREYLFDATVTADLQIGDLVIPFTSALPGAGTTTLGLVIVRCTQVAYGSLLAALQSDRFVMNMIRYVIPNTALIAQYSNNIGVFKQSLYGKSDYDFVSPNSHKKPEQMQNGLIDIPLKQGIDKGIALGQWVNYDCIEQSWSIFVWSTSKISV
jgi:hypothetical protein